MKKSIFLLLFLLFVGFVTAYEKTIYTSLDILQYFNGTGYAVNITPRENSTLIYSDTNNSFSFNFQRNISDCQNQSKIDLNLSGIEELTNTCRESMGQLINNTLIIQTAMIDFSTYFDKYSNCVGQLTECNVTKNTYASSQSSLTTCEQNKRTIKDDADACHMNYDNPNNNNNCKTQVVNLETELAAERGRRFLWIIIGLIIPSIIVIWQNKDRFRREKRGYAIPPPQVYPK